MRPPEVFVREKPGSGLDRTLGLTDVCAVTLEFVDRRLGGDDQRVGVDHAGGLGRDASQLSLGELVAVKRRRQDVGAVDAQAAYFDDNEREIRVVVEILDGAPQCRGQCVDGKNEPEVPALQC